MEIGHDLQKSTDTIAPERQWRKWFEVSILVMGNFCVYADRYTLVGVLVDVQEEFQLDNEMGGLIQTVFYITYTISALIYGYLGDRYDRTFLLCYSLVVWNCGNVGCSFVTQFWAFLVLKGVFGLGQACFVTVAPTIIGDLFIGPTRSKVLVIFYLAIPMGSGIGYAIGTKMTDNFGTWRASLRATPFFSLVVFLLIVFVLRDPYRGHIEGKHHMPRGSWWQDVKYLFGVKTYIFCTLAYTSVAFCNGALSWWTPKMLALGLHLNNRTAYEPHTVASNYGYITIVSGFLALSLGYLLTFKFQDSFKQIDPVVCASGLLVSAPLLVGCTYMAQINTLGCYSLLFFGLVAVNLNWALTCDIMLRVVARSKRASAVGLQLLVGHSLGDAGSPFLLGLMADKIYIMHQKIRNDKQYNEFLGLRSAFFTACGAALLGAVFFSLTAVFIEHDKVKEEPIKAIDTNPSTSEEK